MGIKSTVRLSRTQALALFYELRAKLYDEKRVELTNYELGNKLDEMADEWAERNNTTCFDNYDVVDDHLFEPEDPES